MDHLSSGSQRGSRPNTVKASAYRSEYIALRIAKEMIEALWYKKLRMNGIALDGPANGFVDHESVVFNTIIPSLCIKKKKHNSTDFHKTRGSVVNSRVMRI